MAIELTTASAATLSGIQVFTSALSPEIMFPNAKLGAVASAIFTGQGIPVGDTVDFSHPTFRKVQYVSTSSVSTLTKIIGGQNLISLEDLGTSQACSLGNGSFSAATLNAFFTALPATVRTATINIAGCTGALTCNTSIATAKGYTVVTS